MCVCARECVNQAAGVVPVGDTSAPLRTVPVSVELFRGVVAPALGCEPALLPGTDGSHRGPAVAVCHPPAGLRVFPPTRGSRG